jgi:cytochrome c
VNLSATEEFMRRFAWLAHAGVTLCWASPASADGALIARGGLIAEKNCGRCHAIGEDDKSPNPKLPPFRRLSRKYPLGDLGESLGEGILVGHDGPEMPQFRLSTAQIEALLAYLAAIQTR